MPHLVSPTRALNVRRKAVLFLLLLHPALMNSQSSKPPLAPARSGYPSADMMAEEIFYQNEAPCACEHYKNLMNPEFDRAGIGVWVSNGRVRVVIDFYHP